MPSLRVCDADEAEPGQHHFAASGRISARTISPFNFFVMGRFDFGLVVVYFVKNKSAYNKVCSIHRMPRIGTAGVGLFLRIKGKIIALMLVLLVLVP